MSDIIQSLNALELGDNSIKKLSFVEVYHQIFRLSKQAFNESLDFCNGS